MDFNNPPFWTHLFLGTLLAFKWVWMAAVRRTALVENLLQIRPRFASLFIRTHISFFPVNGIKHLGIWSLKTMKFRVWTYKLSNWVRLWEWELRTAICYCHSVFIPIIPFLWIYWFSNICRTQFTKGHTKSWSVLPTLLLAISKNISGRRFAQENALFHFFKDHLNTKQLSKYLAIGIRLVTLMPMPKLH